MAMSSVSALAVLHTYTLQWLYMIDARWAGAIIRATSNPLPTHHAPHHVLRITRCSLQLSRRDEHSEVGLPNY